MTKNKCIKKRPKIKKKNLMCFKIDLIRNQDPEIKQVQNLFDKTTFFKNRINQTSFQVLKHIYISSIKIIFKSIKTKIKSNRSNITA